MATIETDQLEPGRVNPRLLLRGLLLIATLVVLAYLVETSHLGELLRRSWIDHEVRGQGLHGELLFIAVGALAMAVGLPRQLVGFLGGYAFGFLGGVVWALSATVGGCVVAFYFARWLGRPLVASRFEGRIRRVDDFIHDHPFSMTLLIRLLPVGNNLVTTLTAGVSSVSAWPFLIGSAIGFIPQTVVFALAGSGINADPVLRIGLAVALLPVTALIGINLYRRYRRDRSLDGAVDGRLGPIGDGSPGT